MEHLKNLLSEYNQKCINAASQISVPIEDAHIQYLSHEIASHANALIHIGDEAQKSINNVSSIPTTKALALWVHFEWIEESKQVLLLWRDTLFEYQKARILLLDDQTTLTKVEELHRQASLKLTITGEFLEDKLDKGLYALRTEKRIVDKIEKWQILIDPWPVYKEQIGDIARQASLLIKHYHEVKNVGEGFEIITNAILAMVSLINSEVQQIESLAQSAITSVEKYNKEPTKIILDFESIEEQLNTTVNLDESNASIDEKLTEYNILLQVPIDTQGGLIRYKEINFGKITRQWLESEVLTFIYEMVDIAERASNALKMALINTRNRAIILSKEASESKNRELGISLEQPLHTFSDNLMSWQQEVKDINEVIEQRLSEIFRISHLFNQRQEFLPVPIQSTLNQLKLDPNQFWTKVRLWFQKRTTTLHQIKTTVLKEESLSDAERIIRFVKSRTYNPDHHHYDSIFTAEGYIGDSFCVGRKNELEHISQLLTNWKAGFHGAVILHGQRFSGKTLFGDWVCHKYMHKEAIVLRPNSTIHFEGRRLLIEHHLGEALDFINRYGNGRNHLIWIDDIELWKDKNIAISENIDHLKRHMDKGGSRFFLMVSMNTWTMSHYDRFYDFDRSIPSRIDLTHMSNEDLIRAILIRHGATHKTLMDMEGQKMSPSEFNRLAKNFCRVAQGNVGETLRLWAYASEVSSEQHVTMTPLPTYELPDFITDDNAIVLRAILLKKITNEYELSKQFGPAFQSKYGVVIQRLIAVGVLTRREDGRLEIAEGVVNGIAHLLAKHRHIQFTKP